MELLQHALQEKLTNIEAERGRWQQYSTDYTQAEQNLIGFRESLQKDILVPIGTKALMPGKLYHTNEILVGMYSGLFVKCSSHKATELCQHRLKRSKERLDALDAEYKMYKDRIDLPMAEDAFGHRDDAREIIEEYNEDEEQKWREQHKIRVREQKQREAIERREREQSNAKDDIDVMEILERAELMEELENELEQLNVMNDEQMEQHLQSGRINGEDSVDGSQSHHDASDDYEDFGDDDDDIIPDEFKQLSATAASMSTEEKLSLYKDHLHKVNDYLATRKFSKFEELKELADKRGVQECLRNAIDEIAEECAKQDRSATPNSDLEMDEAPSESVGTLSPPDGRKCLTVAEFKQLEQSYVNRSKSVALVFYKSQLRSVMKSIASCSKGAQIDHMTEKRKLYEYINDAIDRLRAEILLEKQAKLEEKFVDDDTDNEAPADDDDGLIEEDTDDIVPDPSAGGDGLFVNITNGTLSADSAIVSPTKRKICFASKPSVTTYHLDDEPWRVQNSSGQTDETINNLMDETFGFFNSPSTSSSASECDYDGQTEGQKAIASLEMTNSTNKCDDGGVRTNLCTLDSRCDDYDDNGDDGNRLESISQGMPSATKTICYKDGSTLYLKFAHTPTPSQQSSPVGLAVTNPITSPVDIYEQFGCDTVATTAATTNNGGATVDTQSLKDYVTKTIFNAEDLEQKMANYLAGKSGSSSLPNGNHMSLWQTPSVVEPKKSILKNCEAVKREIHGDIYDQIEDEDASQNFYTQARCDPFIGFDQILGDICEKPNDIAHNNNNNNKNSKNNNINNNRSDGVAIESIGTSVKKRVSLFKLNRMS